MDIITLQKYMDEAIAKHPDSSTPWNNECNLFESVAVIACEIGEALNAAYKFVHQNTPLTIAYPQILDELYHILTTTIRTIKLLELYEEYIQQ